MSVFDRLDAAASRTVDTINQTRFILTPMTSTPNGSLQADPGRQVIVGKGIFDYLDGDAPIEVGNRDRRGNDLRSLLNAPVPVLSVDRRAFPNLINEVHQGDEVELSDRRDLGKFKVSSVRRDDLSRLEIRLAAG